MATNSFNYTDTVDIPFIGPAYENRSKDVSVQRCVNLYPEISPEDTITESLQGTPGLRWVSTVGVGEFRGALEFKGDAYFVVGSELIRMDTAETYSAVGTLSTASGVVSMASNGTQGDQLVLVDGTNGYLWDGTTFSTITFGASISPEHVVFMDSYFLCNNKDTGQLYRSDLNDGTTWGALNFATAERDPDDIHSVIVNRRELWLIGEYSTEVWYNDGSDFKFGPIANAFIEYGTPAKHSVAKADSSVFWISQTREGNAMIMRSQGYNPIRISTHALEVALQGYTKISDARAYTYQQAGHTFYLLTFPTANKTWVYDVSTQKWHERTSWKQGGGYGRHRGNAHLFFNNKNYVGDYTNGSLYYFDLDYYTDNENTIQRIRTSQHTKTNHLMRFYKLEIDFEGGVGITTGQGSDPQAMLRFSDDGGHTWSNEMWAPVGALGDYNARSVWHHLGSARDRVWELTISDPIKVVITQAFARVGQSLIP